MNNQNIIDIGNMAASLIPKEGETISLRGGHGNKTLHQRKKEDGRYFVRQNENCNWEERPDLLWEDYLKMKKMLNI